MSLEQKIDELIDALHKNTVALIGAVPPASEPKAPKAAKPKTEPKPEPKPEPVAESLEPKVEKAIESMLKANKRKEAIALLASFNGAKSKTSIIEQGEEVMQKFLDGAEEILLGS
jgi:outer membrane biosynthesis protein TonB